MTALNKKFHEVTYAPDEIIFDVFIFFYLSKLFKKKYYENSKKIVSKFQIFAFMLF